MNNNRYLNVCGSCKAPFQCPTAARLCPQCGSYLRLNEVLRQLRHAAKSASPRSSR
jgi:hypothetical protein